MARAIEVAFPESSGLDRVRNFAEELSLALGELGNLPMAQADTATRIVLVSHIPKRKLGRCRQLIERLVIKHPMLNEAVMNSSDSWR